MDVFINEMASLLDGTDFLTVDAFGFQNAKEIAGALSRGIAALDMDGKMPYCLVRFK